MTSMRLAAALAAAAAVTAQPAAAATLPLVPGASIGRVALGDERAVVEGRVGPGTPVGAYPGPTPALHGVVLAYASAGLRVAFGTPEASARAEAVSTRSSRYATASGIRVGATLAALRHAYPGIPCRARRCALVRVAASGEVRVTRFDLAASGRIARVALYVAAVPGG